MKPTSPGPAISRRAPHRCRAGSRIAWSCGLQLALALPAAAQDRQLHGYLDLRLVAPPAARSAADGGEGRLRYGGGGLEPRLGAALVGSAQLGPSLLAVGAVQWQERDGRDVDLIEAYLRWRPVSTTRARWTWQLGAFFPPVSLENDGIGWTSRWTLTPSAINSWVGEELRTIGAQGSFEWRGEQHTLAATGALFGRNDPAGEILFARGWSLTDLSCGPGCSLREPDRVALELQERPPRRFDPYVEVDDRIGAYAGLEWDAHGRAKVQLLHYDNNADGSTDTHFGASEIYTWETRFWSLGASVPRDEVLWLAQAMHGETYFKPSPFFQSEAEFDAGFVLAAWDRGRWRPALRLDAFRTREHASAGRGAAEHGRALTLALNWRPRDWLRVTAELLRLEGRRDLGDGGAVELDATQLQLNARLLF